jgi:serine/threonine-protein kinase RsbT
MEDELRVEIALDADIVRARAAGRELASRLDFSRTDGTLIATAISEVARNILVHAGHGEIVLHPVFERDRHGLVVVARDFGPGIAHLELALQDGWGSRGGLGLGLPGARRLMDDFDIESAPGEGTTVTMTKWRTHESLERTREPQAERQQVRT